MATSSLSANIPDRIASEIQALINRGTLSPGVHLGQAELADRFSTSRVPVREALNLLAAKGSLSHDPNRGFFVAPLSSDEARQLYRLRHLLEVELLATIEWPNKNQLTTLQALFKQLELLLSNDARQEWAQKQREFHLAVFGLSPNKLILREVIRLWMLTDRYRSLLLMTLRPKGNTKMPLGSEEERMLLDALAKKDRKRLLTVYDEERTHVEELLLGVLMERGL